MSLENPMDGGAWWAAAHGVTKRRTRLSNFTFPFHSHALEKEMATHSSVLAWKIPGTGEPGGLPSMGSHSQTWVKWLSSSSSSYDEQESGPETAGRDEEPLVVSVAFLAVGVQWLLKGQVKRHAGLERRRALALALPLTNRMALPSHVAS